MADLTGWLLWAAGSGAAVVAGWRLDRVVQVHLGLRARLRVERLRSKRDVVRARSLMRLTRNRPVSVRIVERDADGFRMIEIRPDAVGVREAA